MHRVGSVRRQGAQHRVEHVRCLHLFVERSSRVCRDLGRRPQTVAFRFVGGKPADLDALNQSLVVELQERGIAAPSTTRVGGNLAIRVNITNHRTRAEDLELLLREARKVGGELAAN